LNVVAQLRNPRRSISLDNFHEFKKRNIFLNILDSERQTVHRKTNLRPRLYRNMRHQADGDTLVSNSVNFDRLFIQQRSKVTEIIFGGVMIFAVTEAGTCSAFLQNRSCGHHTLVHACYMNIIHHEVIRSMFFNKFNNSVITVGVSSDSNFGTLFCRSTFLEDIEQKHPERGSLLLPQESLKWPGFVEFDDINKKILSFSVEGQRYKVWDLQTYSLLYEISGLQIDEIKISPGIMLLVYNLWNVNNVSTRNSLELRVLNIETGCLLTAFNQPLHPVSAIQILEQFNSKLLIKQVNHKLQIVDVFTRVVVEIDFRPPNAFIFLFENELFLTFLNQEVLAWNMKGEIITRFANHRLKNPTTDTSTVSLNTTQQVLISFCEDKRGENSGSINFSDVFSGQLLGKIGVETLDCNSDLSPHDKAVSRNALAGVTSLVYHESFHSIYTGHEDGTVHVWSS
jgi:hypothetical protein